jgi:DNA-binding winged helix-turn-helix (wHTH) protein
MQNATRNRRLRFAQFQQIRLALGDDAATPLFMATLKKRGYRFTALVELVDRRQTRNTATIRWQTSRCYSLRSAVLGSTAAALRAGK